MGETDTSPRPTCGSVALIVALALIVVVALQRQAQPPTWASTAAAAVAVVAVFLIERSAQNFFWGLLAAMCLTLHPTWKSYTDDRVEEILAGAVVLAAMAATGIGWRLAFHPRFAWRSWPLVFGSLAVCTGLAWKGQKYLGMLAAVVSVGGLAAAAFLAARYRGRDTAGQPSRLNFLMAALTTLLAPLAGVIVYRFLDRTLDLDAGYWPLVRDSLPETMGLSTGAFGAAQLHVWSWPHPWLVLPLLAWALYLSVRRGWRQWSQAQPPAAWFLACTAVLLTAALFVHPDTPGEGIALILTAMTVLLLVSLVAEVLRHIGERLVLKPPEEAMPMQGAPTPEITPPVAVPSGKVS